MKKRTITSAVYVVVFVGLILLKWLVPGGWGSLGFDALFCAIAIIGSIELFNAYKIGALPHRAVTIAYCAVIVPLYAIMEIMAVFSGVFAALFCTVLYVIILAIFWAIKLGGCDTKSFLISLFAMGYCGVLCCVLSAVNHLRENSVAAILLLFLVIMITDSAALVFGVLFKKWLPYKLAPRTSPNKTIIGGVGGLLGGMVAAIAAYYLYVWLGGYIGTPLVYSGSIPGVVAFLLIGLVTSIFDQGGDLFESAIKRKCGIKDMSNLLPGHGGILDRFDSMLFSGVIILLSFSLMLL